MKYCYRIKVTVTSFLHIPNGFECSSVILAKIIILFFRSDIYSTKKIKNPVLAILNFLHFQEVCRIQNTMFWESAQKATVPLEGD